MSQPAKEQAPSVLLVGYEDRDNLGLRYLLSSLEQAGYACQIVRYDSDPASLIQLARETQPVLIGFSLIFQYMAPDFAQVIGALRDDGQVAHITMGGHYPSFDYAQVLERIPGLDSVVRFEGEATLVELVQHLVDGQCWQELDGIARREGEGAVTNALRKPIEDLDQLPVPNRLTFPYESEALPTAAVLGSRGCPWDCSFCSIRPFYEAQGGALRRYRKPLKVAEEMGELYRQRGVTLFLFQDDDFLAGGKRAQRWALELSDCIERQGLRGKIAYKISCRSDEVDGPTLSRLQAGGLTHVYMGVESGSEHDLADMNKRLSPDRHIEAGEVLRSLGMSFDFGFMLLQPYSNFDSVRANIEFLDRFVGDGWTVASFCRMLPYAGTPMKARLEQDGRMLGNAFEPDYRFLDPRLDLFYDWMLATFHERNFTSRGLCHVLRAMLFEAQVQLDGWRAPEGALEHLRYLTSLCNRSATYTLTAALDHIQGRDLATLQADRRFLVDLTGHEKREEERILTEVADLYGSFASANRELPGGFDKTWTHVEEQDTGALATP